MKRAFKTRVSTKLGRAVEHSSEYERARMQANRRFKLDQQIFQEIGLCSFIRPLSKGELEGFEMPEGINASSIKHIYVLCPGSMEHVKKHMRPLPTHLGAVMFDMVNDERVHARILLTDEQVEVIKSSMNKAETGLYLNGKKVK